MARVRFAGPAERAVERDRVGRRVQQERGATLLARRALERGHQRAADTGAREVGIDVAGFDHPFDRVELRETGESAVEALSREWKEELSLDVTVGKFLFCGESVPAETKRTQVFQMVFQIDSIEGNIEVKREGALAGYDWIPINRIDEIAFFPDCLPQVKAFCRGETYANYQRYRWLT